MTRPFLMRLYALRAQVDALVAEVEEAVGLPGGAPPGSCPKCGSGDDDVAQTKTFGTATHYRCLKCAHEWDG